MRSNGLKSTLAAFAAALLVGCSGGSLLEPATDPGTTPTPTGASPAAIILSADSAQLLANADTEAEGVTITAIILDSGSRTIADVPVTFSLGSVASGVLIVTNGTTDASGIAQAVLTTGGNATFPRTVTIFASAGGITASGTINVVDPTTPPTTVTANNLTLFTSAAVLPADADTAAEGVQITAAATDSAGVVVAGVPVQFSVTAGNGALQVVRDTTDSSGTASAILTTNGDSSPRTITVRATITTTTGTIVRTVNLPVVIGASEVNGTVSSLRLPADNSVPVTVRARATNEFGAPVNGVPVTFFVSSGGITGGTACSPASTRCTTLLTDSTGETGLATITTGGVSTPRIITVTLDAPGNDTDPDNNTADIVVVPVVANVDVLSTSSNLLANADTVAEGVGLVAVVTDATGAALANEAVTFSITSGNGAIVVGSGVTDATGSATATLITTNTSFPRTIVVRATAQCPTAPCAATKFGERTINVVDPSTPPTAPSVGAIELLASGVSMAGDADTAAEGISLTALVTDGSGNVVPDVAVAFTVTVSTGALQVTRATTDDSGTATAILTTGGNETPRTITVTSSVTGSSGTLTDTVQVAVVAPASTVSSVSVTRSDPQLREDADTTAEGVTFTALARNSNGVALAGKLIAFAVSSSGGVNRNGALTVTQATTDANGNATAVLAVGQAQVGDLLTVTATFDAPTGTDPTGSASVTVVQVASAIDEIDLLASSPQLSSNAIATANGVTLTAIVKDASQSVLEGVPVTFAITSSGPTGDGTLTPINLTTNSSGIAQAILTTGGNPRNRTITVRASAAGFGGPNPNVSISVVGTNVNISGPTNTQSGVQTEYVAVLLDSGGGPISGQTVNFDYVAADFDGDNVNECAGTGSFFNVNGTANASGNVSTNVSGLATIRLNPTTCGSLVATGLGATDAQNVSVSTDCFEFITPDPGTEVELGDMQTVTVRWELTPCDGSAPVVGEDVNFSTTRGAISGGFVDADTDTTDASGEATITISASQAGAALITASSDALTKPAADLSIEFVATDPETVAVQASPGTIATNQQSTISAVVRDEDNNLVKNATVQFLLTDTTGGSLSAGQAITNSQGRAQVTYSASSTPSSANGVSITGTVTAVNGAPVTNISGVALLTVGSAGLNITLGTGNTLSEEGPPSGETTYVLPYLVTVTDSANNPAPNAQLSLSVHPIIYRKGTSEFPLPDGPWVRTDGSGGDPIDCTNEDLLTGATNSDLNGILDAGEDLNGDGVLQPGGVALVPQTVALDANGIGNFEVRYPKDVAYWVRVRLRATAAVAGTEAVTQAFFDLPGLADDFDTASEAPPGFESPYGTLQDCTHTGEAQWDLAAQSAAASTTVNARITLTHPAGNTPITVPVTVTGDAVPAGTDYTLAGCAATPCNLNVVIPAGASAGGVSFTVANAPTSGRVVTLTLGTPSSQAIVGTTDTQTVILEGAIVNFDTTSTSVAEGAAETTIKVELDNTVGSAVTIPYTINPNNAGSDYTDVTAGSVTIPMGELSGNIRIQALADGDANTSESFTITLGTPTAGPAILGSSTSHTLTITD